MPPPPSHRARALHPQRPVFFNLLLLRLPVGAVASIAHRVSGALLALALPGLLYVLMRSLRSEADFQALAGWFGHDGVRLALVLLVWALVHHGLAGVRHLGLDLGWGEGRRAARVTAMLALALGGLAAAWAAWRLWT